MSEKLTYVYKIDIPPEPAAGLRGLVDTVTVEVASGDPGGDLTGDDSFGQYMLQVLRDWYDTSHVRLHRGGPW